MSCWPNGCVHITFESPTTAAASPGMPACARKASTYPPNNESNWLLEGGSACARNNGACRRAIDNSRARGRTSRLYHFGSRARLYTPGKCHEENALVSCCDTRGEHCGTIRAVGPLPHEERPEAAERQGRSTGSCATPARWAP